MIVITNFNGLYGSKWGNLRRGTCGRKRLLHTEIGVCTSFGVTSRFIYETPAEKEDCLVHRILGACEAINKMQENFERVRQYVVRRSNACDETGSWLL
jgi:hypothetical protein